MTEAMTDERDIVDLCADRARVSRTLPNHSNMVTADVLDKAAAEIVRLREELADAEQRCQMNYDDATQLGTQLDAAYSVGATAHKQIWEELQSLRSEALEVVGPLHLHGSRVAADLQTAHQRGDAASDWMREDDAELRNKFYENLARAAKFLTKHGGK